MKRSYKPVLCSIAIFIGLWLIFEFAARLFAEVLWFKEVDYLSTFIIRRQSQGILWLLVTCISGTFLGGHLWLAERWQWQWQPKDKWYDVGALRNPNQQQQLVSDTAAKATWNNSLSARRYLSKKTYPTRIKLPLLLFAVISGTVAITAILLHYSEVAQSVWQTSYRLPQISRTFKPPLDVFDWANFMGFVLSYLRQLGLVIVLVWLILWQPQVSLQVITTLLGIIFGLIAAGNWTVFLRFFNPSEFGFNDPQFHQDIGFYFFHLPLWQLVESWLLGLSCFALISSTLIYTLSGNSLSEGGFPGFSKRQLRHLSFLGGVVMVAIALQHWLNRFDLLYGFRGVVYGAGYTNIRVQLPIEMYLGIIAIISAIWLFYKSVTGYQNLLNQKKRFRRTILLVLPFIAYLLVFSLSSLFSATVQRLVVQPNELVKEIPYIERSIEMTRRAFNLDEIEAQTFNPQGKLTAEDIQNNDSTIKNIRLWDIRPVLQTNRQLQQIRPYYQFYDADIDRYLLSKDKMVSKKQQVIIAARELDYRQVVDIAKTWVNEHLIYTHGYGFTLSPVNRVAEGGLPYYYIKDIGTGSKDIGTLTVSDETIKNSIAISKPRIYYGELTNPFILTSTKLRELDFPSGEENVYTVYDGTGGIKIGNYYRRVLFAEYLKDWKMLFARNFTADTKLLFRRDIKQRIRAIAPFLNYDQDPYLVAAKKNTQAISQASTQDSTQDNLYWIIDAYTTSDRYPYSDPGKNSFNYLRNSVKVVVDAYNGKVDFYIADPKDPLIQTWDKIFPQLFKPLTAMPPELRSHIRYPEDLFGIQSERLLTYHMTDPQVFYNREDQWQIPKEIYGAKSQAVSPYYLIMKLPTEAQEEFIMLHPYTPTNRPNLIAWLAARSDGEEYGKLLLYKFPKQKLIYGPTQIEALINQDPIISQQISLWDREGSRAIQGNLLIIPIEQSLLYVEPLYLEAAENSLPALSRVIVVYENQIVMAETLNQAIKTIFKPESDSGAIVRPVKNLDTN